MSAYDFAPKCPLRLGAEVRAPAWRLPFSGGKQTFDLNVRFSADYVRFGPKSGRIDTVTVESARHPKRTYGPLQRFVWFGISKRTSGDDEHNDRV